MTHKVFLFVIIYLTIRHCHTLQIINGVQTRKLHIIAGFCFIGNKFQDVDIPNIHGLMPRPVEHGPALDFICINLSFIQFNGLGSYIPLTLYPRGGSRDISDIPPRRPRFTEIT
jgi:hypothetical protein